MPNRWEMPPAYIPTGDPETMNETSLLYGGQLGIRFTQKQMERDVAGAEAGRSKRYQIVKTDSTMSVAPFRGAVAWWSDKTQYLVTTSPTALGRNRIAGVFQNAISPGNYGCVQIGGPAIVKFIDAVAVSPSAVGLPVIPSATAGKADTIAAGGALTYATLGVTAGAYDAVNAEAVCDLNVPETT